MLKAIIVVALGAALAACAQKPPATTLFEVRSGYDATVLAPMVRYHQLPVCPVQSGVCKDLDVDRQLIQADKDTKAVLDAAEDSVGNHPGIDATSLIADAVSAVNAVAVILANHGIK